jgi:Phosphatidylglycerophosphate synthase
MTTFTRKDIFTASNFISFFRIFLAIPLWLMLDKLGEGNYRMYVLAVCFLVYLSDIADGFLARKLNEVTEVGKIIDPLADKIVVGALVIKLFLINLVPAYYFYLVVGRDILIFTGGIFLSKKIGKVLPSNYLGKITVVFIGMYFLFLLSDADKESFFYLFFYVGSIILIFASLIAYFIRGMEFLKKKNGTI